MPAHAHAHEHPDDLTDCLSEASSTHGIPKGGPVLLDIGDDIGALIVRLNDDRVGDELYAEHATGRHLHTGIWPRRLGGHDVVVAVFPELTVGRWSLVGPQGTSIATADIVGGEVRELDLRT
jgi:hypothetical protein